MPAVFDPDGRAAMGKVLRVWRPLGPRIMVIVLVGALFVVCGVMWQFGFSAQDRAEVSGSERATMIFFGLMIAAVAYALGRSRAEAREKTLVIVNGYRVRVFAWAQVIAIRFPPGAPWASLDLADGETCPVMGIQASDGDRARRAAGELARLIVDHS